MRPLPYKQCTFSNTLEQWQEETGTLSSFRALLTPGHFSAQLLLSVSISQLPQHLSIPQCLSSRSMMWACMSDKPFPPQVVAGMGVHHSNREENT